MNGKKLIPIAVLTILIVAFLCTAVFVGCSSSSDDGGGSGTTTSLTGTVTDSATAAAISGATVKLGDTETTTDSSGNYTLSGLSAGTYTLTVSKTGYTTYQASITIVEGTNTQNITLTAETSQTGTLTGTVKSGDAEVESVLVSLQNIGTYTTAADGVYTFAQVTYGTYTITATKTGYNNYSASVTINAATNTHNISLTTSSDLPEPEAGKGHVTGYVTDDSGNPLENVKCTLYAQSGKVTAKTVIVYTDSNGRYVFLNVDPGTYQLEFSLGGYNIPFIIVTVTAGTVTEPPANPGSPSNPNPPNDPPTYIKWQHNYGGSADDYCYSIVQLSDGGYIAAGDSFSSNSGDFTGTNNGNDDFWIIRMNSLGQILWQKNYGGSSNDSANSIIQTSDGGYIVAGDTFSSASGDVTGTNNGESDFWVVKLDSSGTIQWQKNYGGSGREFANDIQQTSDGGYIVAGGTLSSASGDVTGTNNGGRDYWVVKLNNSGTIQWQKNYGGSGNEYLKSVRQTSDGGYIVGGYTDSSASGDVTGTNNGGLDIWVVKLNSSGTIQWQKNYGGSDNDNSYSVIQTSDGGYISAGRTNSSASGDVTGTNKGIADFWVVKMNGSGTLEWQKNYGGSDWDGADSILQTTDGGYFIAGYTDSSTSGDVTGANNGNGDMWIVKIDNTGTLLWQHNYGGSDYDEAYAAVQTNDMGFVMCGETDSSASGDVTGTNKGLGDYWIVKVDPNGVLNQ